MSLQKIIIFSVEELNILKVLSDIFSYILSQSKLFDLNNLEKLQFNQPIKFYQGHYFYFGILIQMISQEYILNLSNYCIFLKFLIS